MLEMLTVLVASGILIIIAYEFSYQQRREWGENSKSFF
jgi:Tfp pilus assembly protein PilE